MNTMINKIDNVGTRRVSRGGSWRHRAVFSQVDRRFSGRPDFCNHCDGFRIVKTKEVT